MMILFASLFVLMFIGVPVGFAIGLSSLAYIVFDSSLSISILLERTVSGVQSFTLLAIPLFIASGFLMEKGSTSRITEFADSLVGFIKGGFGMVPVLASAFFGAISGSGVATVAAVGTVMGPEMTKKGFPKGLSASILGSSGTLGMLIPPSITMIVFGVVSDTSIGQLLIAGIIPGIITALLLCATVLIIARKFEIGLDEDIPFSLPKIWSSFKKAILPLMTPIIIIGGIMSGVFTPTESAVIATVYALILGMFVYKELKLKDIPKIINNTLLTSTAILFIMAASSPMSWIINIEQIPMKISDVLLSTVSSPIFIIIAIQLILIILGIFMDTGAIVIITTPIFFPIAMSLGMDPLVYGVTLIINLMIGGATPPLALSLFTACKMMGIGMQHTFKYIWIFLLVLMGSLALHLLIPELSTFLPNLLSD